MTRKPPADSKSGGKYGSSPARPPPATTPARTRPSGSYFYGHSSTSSADDRRPGRAGTGRVHRPHLHPGHAGPGRVHTPASPREQGQPAPPLFHHPVSPGPRV